MESDGFDWRLSPRGKLSLAISAIIGTQSPLAMAQDQLEEIIVTARKRAENLQSVPESILAFSTEQIARAGLASMDDYARFIPSLSYVARGPGANKIIFRGVTEGGTAFFADSSAAIYLDEQALTQPSLTPEPRLIDIERVEALSGPQGSLYGGSAQSGTLRIVTNKADPTRFESEVTAELRTGSSSDIGYDVSGVLNLPLKNDRLALRLVGFSAREGAFIDNVLSDSPGGTFTNAAFVGENVAGEAEYLGGRASLRWIINEDWDATANIVYQDTQSTGDTEHEPELAGDLQQVRFLDEKRDDEWTQFGLTIEGDLGFANLLSASSYFTRDIFYSLDNTTYVNYLRDFYTYNPTYYIAYALGPDPVGQGWVNPGKTTRFSQEFRLSHESANWYWLAGLYYERYDDRWDFQSRIEDYESTNSFAFWYAYYGATPGTTENAFYHSNNRSRIEQWAAFGELTYSPSDRWSFTAGGRWFTHERDRAYFIATPPGNPGPVFNPVTTTEDTTFKFSASYRFDDQRMLYALYSEGFRFGGGNIARPGAVLPLDYDPDFLRNMELGLKARWFDGKLQTNVTAFHMEWDDFQLGVVDPGPLYAVMITNIGNAEIDGVELDLSVLPTEGLEFALNMLKLNAETTTANSFLSTAAGARLPITPEFKYSASIQYTGATEMFGGNPYLRLQHSYQGDSLNDIQCNTPDCDIPAVQKSFSITDLKIGLESDTWDVNVFVDNLTDEHAQLRISQVPPLTAVIVNRPREYGIRFSKKWGDR